MLNGDFLNMTRVGNLIQVLQAVEQKLKEAKSDETRNCLFELRSFINGLLNPPADISPNNNRRPTFKDRDKESLGEGHLT